MLKKELIKSRIRADNDQDREMARKWMREATPAAKLQIWNEIQKEHTNPVQEIVSRFAQLAFGEMMIEVADETQGEKTP